MGKATIKKAEFGKLPSIAQCHRAAFPNSISTAMGSRYVMRMLDWYLLSDNTFLFYSENNGTVSGYCGGMYKTRPDTGGSATGMAQHSFNEAVLALVIRPWLLFHPEMRSKYPFALKNLKRRFFKKPATQSPATAAPFLPYVSLIVIGVNPAFWGKGIGSRLLEEFEKRALSSGLSKLQLTVRSDNGRAIELYRKNGWRIDQQTGNSTQMSKELQGLNP